MVARAIGLGLGEAGGKLDCKVLLLFYIFSAHTVHLTAGAGGSCHRPMKYWFEDLHVKLSSEDKECLRDE